MDNFASFYNGRLESNSSKNKNELNKCFERHFLQSKYNNIAHMSPIDRLIAKNQQKMKMNCSSVKKPCSNKKENIDKQNKSKNKDTSVSATIRPRKRRINWNETFKEKRRSRRLSHLPPIDEDFKKEIKNEEFCESYSIKIEKDIKSEIKDDTDDNIQQDNNSNLVLNTSDPNVLSNNCIHQQVEFTQENNSFFGNTINDTLNPSTYSENNFASLSYTCDSKTPPWDTSTKIANIEPSNLNLIAQELIQDDSSICSDELSQEDNSNFDFNTLSNNHTPPQVELIQENIAIFENTMNNLLIDSIYSENNFLLAGCNKTNNCNFRLEPDLTSSKTAYNKQTSMNLVYNHELILETADNEQTNLVVKQELNQETVDYEATNIYNYPYNITNIYDTEIHESESCSPKIIECWSFKTNERLIYSEIEENTSSGTTTVQNNDLNKTQEKSHYKNNFEKPKIIASLNTTNVQDNDLNKTQEKSPYKNNSEKPTIIAFSGTTNVQNNDLNKTQEKSPYKNNSEKPTIIASSGTTNVQNNDLNKTQEKSFHKNNSEKPTIIASSGTTNIQNNDLNKTQEKSSHYKNNSEKPTIIASSGTTNVQNNDLNKTQEKSSPYKNNSEKPTIIASSGTTNVQNNDLNKTQEKSSHYQNNSEKPTIIASSGTTNVQNNDLNKIQEKSHYQNNSEKPTIIASSGTTNVQNNDLNKTQEKSSHYKNNSEKPTIIASSGTTNVQNNDLNKTQEKSSHYKSNSEKPTIITSSSTTNIQNNDLNKIQEKSHYKNNSEKSTIIASSGTTNVHNNDLYKTQEKSHYKNNPEKSTIIASSGTINVQNNDLYKTQEKSHYKNNSEKPTIIESSSLFAMQDELELSIKNRSLTPKTYSRKNQNKMSKPSLLNSSKIATPKANSIYLPSTYFDDTNNKLINYESILPVTQSQNEINYSKLENKITKDSILLNNITVKDETVEEEIPILQKNFYELSIDEKISYQTKLTFVTALELVSIKELKNIQIIKEKKDVIPNQFSSPLELSIDNENYTNKKIVPTGSEIKELSFLLQDSNDRNNTRHAAMPILVPERSSGSSFHPGRICAQNCSACYVILGSMDTVCHIAQVKNPEKQKICLENVNHLIGLNSCLCPTCFHIVQRKSSVAYLSKYVCTFMSCKLPASKYYKSECVKKIKCMLIKTGVKIRSWANNTNLLPTCNTHHDEILKVIQCQLCGNQSTHKKILEISELEDFNKSLIEDGIPITLDTDFFICKSCHLYLLWKNNKLSDSLNKPKDIRDHCSNVIKRICEHHKINIPVSVNEILEKNIIYTDKNVLRIQSKRIPFKPRRKRKVPKKNIKGTHQNTFKMYSKLIPVNSITKNKVPENNIKATDENVFKKSAKLTSTKYNTLNKIPENNITNTAQKTCKIYSKVTPMISNTVNKVYINNFEDVKTIFFKMPVKVMSTKSSTIYKTPTMNSFKTSINNKNDQLMVLFKPSINKNVNCQTLNLQPGRLLPLEFIENQPLSTQPNIKLVHKKKLFTTDTALPRNNLKQILDPLSTNNIPLQKVQHIKSAMKPDTPKLLSCSSNKSMPKQKVGPVVGTSILPLADPLSLPNLPEFQFNDTLKLKVVSDVFKLYKQLQKPFFSSIELFKFLLLLEKYRLQGELIQNKKFKSPCSLKQNSIMNQHIPKYIFPQFKRKRNNKNHCEQLGVTPLHKNAILPINSLYDGKITKYTNMNTNAKVQMKQNLSTPSIPVTTKKEPLIKIISIPKSVVATSICKPSEIIPDNNQIIIPPINTTIDSFNSSPLVISENSTTAAKCITNIENIAMKRVYPLYLNYSPVDLNMTRNFQPIVPLTVNCKQISSSSKKKVKNLKVIHTTQQ